MDICLYSQLHKKMLYYCHNNRSERNLVMKLGTHIDENIPLYAQIADDLRLRIISEEWKPGEKIPSEMKLCEAYHVSRITIRKSIEELTKEKLVYRERAKGTTVCEWAEEEDEHFTLVRSFTNEMKELGRDATTVFAEISVVKADRKIAQYLEVEVGDSVMKLKRIRGDRQKAFVYFVTYFPYSENYSLKNEDYYDSFYEYLEQFGISIDQEKEYIEATLPTKEVQDMLKIKRDEPILKRVRMTKHRKSSFREYSENFYIGSEYRYYIDFS